MLNSEKYLITYMVFKSVMTDHIWSKKDGHQPQWKWSQDREQHWKIRRPKESAHMLGTDNLYSRPTIEITII